MLLLLLALTAGLAGCVGDSEEPVAGGEAAARSAPAPAGAPLATETAPEVTRAGLEEHLRALQRAADRNDGNRAAGTTGDRASTAYVVARLREAGWRVARQRVRFPYYD